MEQDIYISEVIDQAESLAFEELHDSYRAWHCGEIESPEYDRVVEGVREAVHRYIESTFRSAAVVDEVTDLIVQQAVTLIRRSL